MPVENFVVNKISPDEESAINTAAAMATTIAAEIEFRVQKRLEALEVAFTHYPGEWSYGVDPETKLVWNGVSLRVYRNSELNPGQLTETELRNCDPRVQFLVSRSILGICREFTSYLNNMLLS